MIASEPSDYSSDDSMSLSASELILTEVSQSNKSKYDSNNDASDKDSPLKRAIKENETLIIQSILSHAPLSSPVASSNGKSSNSNSITDHTTSTTTTTVGEGLSPLLDYLFEDGQLTRIEYDRVDKGYGINSAAEQVQVMLRILMESKDEGALEILLECISRLNPTSEVMRRLCTEFLPGTPEYTERVVFLNEIKLGRQQQSNKKARVPFELDSSLEDNRSFRKLHDFYYGRRQIHNSTTEKTIERDDGKRKNADRIYGTLTQQQMNKARNTLDSTDFRDFHLTNGCLETIRNLILDNCEESIKATGWEKVLRNMNGLLSTDVVSIKDLLFQIKTLDHQRVMEEETRVAKFVRKVYRKRRKLQQFSIQKQKRESFHITSEGKDNENDEALRRRNSRDGKKGGSSSSKEKRIENKQEWNINWNQVIYHSFQVWKQRNGINATFYSLIGVFQHSKLYQTADLLLECKTEIQLRENEKDIADGSAFDVNNGTKVSAPSTMLEKSDFLRKFYSPSRRGSDNNNSGNFKPVGLTTTKDRVSASPVLSLDLL